MTRRRVRCFGFDSRESRSRVLSESALFGLKKHVTFSYSLNATRSTRLLGATMQFLPQYTAQRIFKRLAPCDPLITASLTP